MSNIMKTRCPHCCVKGAHPVKFTDPNHYIWENSTEQRLKAFNGRGLLYRSRTNVCTFCGKSFDTCVMAEKDFRDVMFLWSQEQYEVNGLKADLKSEEERFAGLLSHFDAFLKRRGAGRINSLSQEVGMLGIELGYDTVQRLKSCGMKKIHDILLSQKSDLVQDDCLTEAQWQKLAALFAESGLELKDDTRSGEDVIELPMTA